MADASLAFTDDHERIWRAEARLAVERISLPFPVVVALAALLAFVEQTIEYSLRDPGFHHLTPDLTARRFILPALIAYTLVMVRLLKQHAVRALAELRPTVLIGDEEYAARASQMIRSNPRAEFALLAFSIFVSFGYFVVADNPLPFGAGMHLPYDVRGLFILLVYALFGWLLLLLLFATFQLGLALGRLASRPLIVNVFDPANLLPFGRLALLHSLSTLGLVFMLLVSQGQPTSLFEWSIVVGATAASTLALVVPIWGVHRQMSRAKWQALYRIHGQLSDLHATLLQDPGLDKDAVIEINNRTSALVSLRKTIYESPNWPFRTASLALRAILVSLSPLIYFLLNELLRAYLLPVIK